MSSSGEKGKKGLKKIAGIPEAQMTLETQIKNRETGSIINSITAQSNENSCDTLSYL